MLSNSIKFVRAAAVVVVGALGVYYFASTSGTDLGGPRTTQELRVNGAYPPITATVSAPDGWSSAGHPWAVTTGSDLTHAAVSFWTVGTVFIDPCQWKGAQGRGDIADPALLEGDAGDVAIALSRWWGADPGIAPAGSAPSATVPTDTTLAGFAGKYVEVTAPTDVDFADCDGGEYRPWLTAFGSVRYLQAPGQLQRLWILDVGSQVLVIDANNSPGASSELRAELESIVNTIVLGVPSSQGGSLNASLPLRDPGTGGRRP